MSTEGALIGGRYRLSQRVGHGRGGFVWIAQDTRVHRTVAAKPRQLDSHGRPGTAVTGLSGEETFAVEQARLAAKLRHPGVVSTYDVVVESGTVWLITEYVPSRTMADFLAGHGHLGATDTATLGGQLATALAAAHEQGLVHRAVEPANVLLADDGGVQITDFGTGILKPDAAYRAPELTAGGVATAASDVFSLGATLFFAVEAQVPFGASGVDTGPLLDIAPVSPNADRAEEGLRHALMRMLSADPAVRPSMSGVGRALSAIAQGRKPAPGDLVATGMPPEPAATSPARPEPANAEPQSLSGTLPSEAEVRPARAGTPVAPQVATLPPQTTHPTIPAAASPPPQRPSTPATTAASSAAVHAGRNSTVSFLLLVAAVLAAAVVGVVFTELFLL